MPPRMEVASAFGPGLPYAAGKDTCATLHLWTQIVGEIRLAQTPCLNHSWHVTLYFSRYHAANLEEAPWLVIGGSMKAQREGISALAVPSGTGCVECLATGSWWFHLRRCAQCGHIGCCDSSPNQHASKHHAVTGHSIIASFEPGERWFYDYRSGEFFAGPPLPAPHSHPLDQPVPGPAGRVPSDWQTLLHD